jgi:hypothetical protein
MAQRHVQHLVRHQAGLQRQRQASKAGRRRACGRRWRPIGAGAPDRRHVAVVHPQRQPAGGRRIFHQPLDGARAAVAVGVHGARAASAAALLGVAPVGRAVEHGGLQPASSAWRSSSSIASVCASRTGSGTRRGPRAAARGSPARAASVGASRPRPAGRRPCRRAHRACAAAAPPSRRRAGGQQPHHVGGACSSRSTPKNSAALAAPMRPCTNSRLAGPTGPTSARWRCLPSRAGWRPPGGRRPAAPACRRAGRGARAGRPSPRARSRAPARGRGRRRPPSAR